MGRTTLQSFPTSRDLPSQGTQQGWTLGEWEPPPPGAPPPLALSVLCQS